MTNDLPPHANHIAPISHLQGEGVGLWLPLHSGLKPGVTKVRPLRGHVV